MRKTTLSIRTDSFFMQSHLSLVQIMKIIYFWAKDYPQRIIEIESKVSSKSAVDWYHFIQEVCPLNTISIAYDNTIYKLISITECQITMKMCNSFFFCKSRANSEIKQLSFFVPLLKS